MWGESPPYARGTEDGPHTRRWDRKKCREQLVHGQVTSRLPCRFQRTHGPGSRSAACTEAKATRRPPQESHPLPNRPGLLVTGRLATQKPGQALSGRPHA